MILLLVCLLPAVSFMYGFYLFCKGTDDMPIRFGRMRQDLYGDDSALQDAIDSQRHYLMYGLAIMVISFIILVIYALTN